ncbi:lysoplasmalogenase [soil metagenome]
MVLFRCCLAVRPLNLARRHLVSFGYLRPLIPTFMSVKPTRIFTITFAIVTLLEIVGDTLSIPIFHYGCKPLIMALLLLYGWQCYRSMGSPMFIRWLLIGMVFALAGDVFLMIQEVDLFAPGLGAFLVMQVCYSVAFWQSIHQNELRSNRRSLLLNAIPFALYSGTFLVILKPTFDNTPALTALWWPVVFYVICLSTMGLLSTQRRSLPHASWVVMGALLFILSDSLIAIDKFLHPLSGAAFWIMSTYAAAQYLIVVGMLQSGASVPER